MNCLIAQLLRVPAVISARGSKRNVKNLRSLFFAILPVLCLVCGSRFLNAATVSPSSLSWASVSVGNVGAAKSVTLTNAGSVSISISSVAIAGTNAADFLISSRTCGSSLAANASCSVAIRFKPLSTGTRTATLTMTDSASNSPQKVALSGLGTAAAGTLAASPSSLVFGNVYSGSSGQLLTATLSNGTSSAVAISSVATTGTNLADFAVTSKSCGPSLPAFSSCTATVLFKTAAVGTRTATLSFTDSASNSPQKVSLSGTGIAPVGSLSLSPSGINWASVSVGVGGAPKVATLTNTGTSAVPISSVAITSTDPGDFVISSKTCGTQLAAGASCTITLVFKPKAVGTRVALLTVIDGAIDSPHAVAVSGNGGPRTEVAPSISVDFGSRSGTQIPIQSGMLGAHYLAGDVY